MRLIDADALPIETVGICDAHMNMYGAADVVFVEHIKNAPTIDPVKHARWKRNTGSMGDYIFTCTNCNCQIISLRNRWKYCPHCGAKMWEDDEL